MIDMIKYGIFANICFAQAFKTKYIFLQNIISLSHIYHFEALTVPQLMDSFVTAQTLICVFIQMSSVV